MVYIFFAAMMICDIMCVFLFFYCNDDLLSRFFSRLNIAAAYYQIKEEVYDDALPILLTYRSQGIIKSTHIVLGLSVFLFIETPR